MDAKQVRATVVEMLAAETGCEEHQLSDGRIHVVARRPERIGLPEHRLFNPHPGRIGAVTLGSGAVVSVDAEDLEWATDTYIAGRRDDLFRGMQLAQMIQRGIADRLQVHGPYPRFTVARDALASPPIPPGYTVTVTDIERELAERPDRLTRSQFPNAIFPEPGKSGRLTVLASLAEHRGDVVGLAGVSKDSDFMYQIGIDVLAPHRGRGLAPALTAAAACAVFELGGLPYYGTSSSNVASMRTAISAGFRPTWVEVLTRPA